MATKKKTSTKKKTLQASDTEHPSFLTMSGPLTITAAEGDKKLPTFSMVAYTGGVMRISGFYDPVVVDLEGVQIDKQQIPVRLDHDSRQGVGHTDRVAIDKGKIVASGVISRDTSWAREVAKSGSNGFPWQASIGANVEISEFLDAGKSAVVNGETVTGPAIIARQSVLKEISFTDIGADSNTSAQIAAKEKEQNMSTAKKKKGGDDVVADDAQDQKETIEASGTTDTGKPKSNDVNANAGNSDHLAAMREASAAELERQAKIQELCASGHMDIAAKAIRENWDTNKTELEVLRASRPSAPSVLTGGTEAGPKVLEAAAMMAGGVGGDELLKTHGEKSLEAADKRFRHGISLQELLLEAAWANGYQGRTFRNDMQGVLQAAFSTLSLPGILSNVANKFLLDGFEYVESAWRQIAATRTVTDFKAITSYRLTGNMEYDEIGPTGELKHGTVGEESYTNQAKTYGKMFSITRTDLINDDLGALTALPRRIGRGAALKLNKVFWTAFMDNSTFFATGNANYQSGADTVLSIDSLTAAETLFRNQTNADGEPIASMPKILLVPAALAVTAQLLMSALKVNETTTANKPKPMDNPHAGKFEAVSSVYLSNSAYSGYSALAWYLLSDPNDIPVIEVAFLNGRQMPIVEQSDADFNTLGIQMRGYHDFGVAKQDYRGGVKSKGES